MSHVELWVRVVGVPCTGGDAARVCQQQILRLIERRLWVPFASEASALLAQLYLETVETLGQRVLHPPEQVALVHERLSVPVHTDSKEPRVDPPEPRQEKRPVLPVGGDGEVGRPLVHLAHREHLPSSVLLAAVAPLIDADEGEQQSQAIAYGDVGVLLDLGVAGESLQH